MLKQVTLLNTHTRYYARHTDPQPLDMGMYVFPNHKTGALMGVKYPLGLESKVFKLLRYAHEERSMPRPLHTMHDTDAARMLGISRSVFERWVKKGWIHCWTQWVGKNGKVLTPGFAMFSELEVEALCLARPCDL